MLYSVRCDVVHEGKYWRFNFATEKHKSVLTFGANEQILRVSIYYEELRDIIIKSIIRALLADSTNKILLEKLDKISKHTNIEYKKIIQIYQNRILNSKEDKQIIKLFHNIYKTAKANNDSLISFQILEKAIKRFPEDKEFQLLYKTWSKNK